MDTVKQRTYITHYDVKPEKNLSSGLITCIMGILITS